MLAFWRKHVDSRTFTLSGSRVYIALFIQRHTVNPTL
ncbi:uncharacterized protein METZ01_LOCUS436207, partial [marine metagenome]